MEMQYCFKFQDREICVPIASANDPFWWLSPGPFIDRKEFIKWLDATKPDPTPWIQDNLLDKAAQNDLMIMATIAKLTEELNGQIKKSLHNTLDQMMRQISLPAGVTVKFRQ